MINRILMLVSALAIFFACESNNELKRLKSYLNSFSYTIEDYKVISFVPVDGCGSCINPSLEYVNKSDKDVLLVLTSIYRKSIDFSIENHKITKKELIFDSKNLATQNGYVSNIAPCFYFLKNGEIIRKVDLTNLPDKTGILDEVDNFIKQ